MAFEEPLAQNLKKSICGLWPLRNYKLKIGKRAFLGYGLWETISSNLEKELLWVMASGETISSNLKKELLWVMASEEP